MVVAFARFVDRKHCSLGGWALVVGVDAAPPIKGVTNGKCDRVLGCPTKNDPDERGSVALDRARPTTSATVTNSRIVAFPGNSGGRVARPSSFLNCGWATDGGRWKSDDVSSYYLM